MYALTLRLTVEQVDELDEMVKEARTATDKKIRRSHLIREAIDNMLKKRHDGGVEIRLPIVQFERIRQLVDHGFFSTAQSAVENAVVLMLEGTANSKGFEEKLLRARIAASEAEERRRKNGRPGEDAKP